MASLLDRVRGLINRERPRPMAEQGVGGFTVFGGYLHTPETNPQLFGANRWLKASEILTNVSVVAASLRYTLNLISRPKWKWDPVNDTAEAKAAAEFMDSVIDGIDTSWTRIVRRGGLFRYHGFGVHEWVTKKRDDGKIGIDKIEVRPCHTIEKWDVDDHGMVLGVIQRDPQTSHEIYLPRQKLIYLVDDTLTDRPDGLGWFRHLVEPAELLRSYLKLEAMGFERDLSGIPIGRAPISKIQQKVNSGQLTQAQADRMITQLNDFVSMRRKKQDSGLVLDSTSYLAKTDNGVTVSSIMEWGLELLTGSQNSIDHLGEAINRLAYDMALIMGTESMLVGARGQGSRALSEDKSKNLYLTANATLADMAECMNRDLVTPLWAMNGLPDELKPKANVEDVAFKDVEQIARVLADMANAGAILAPDDPAINDLRDLMGIQNAKPMDVETLNALQGRPDPTKPDPNAELDDERAREAMDREDARAAAANDDDKGKPKPGQRAAKGITKPLYVSRKLTNAAPLIAWAKANGFETTLPADDMHVTVCYSKDPVDWTAAGDSYDSLSFEDGKRSLAALGEAGDAIVLKFEAAELAARHKEFRDVGASWDWPKYMPHVTLSYKAGELDLSQIPPYEGPLEFGPERFETIDEDYKSKLTEKYSANQPRDPKGTSTGGRWTAGPSSVIFEVAPNPDNKELTDRWNKLSEEERLAITNEVGKELAPEVLEKLGVKGAVRDTIGGFEGEINPSLEIVLEKPGREMELAGILGEGLSQKSMVVASAKPMAGLDPVGIAAVPMKASEVRSAWDRISKVDGVDGFTFRNGQMEILNFTGRSNDDFAAEIDTALESSYLVKQSTIYSTLLEAKDYAGQKSGSGRDLGRVFRDNLRGRAAAAVEERLQRFGKAFQAGYVEQLKRYNPSQPRDPKGTTTGGRWTSADGGIDEADRGEIRPLDSETKAQLVAENEGKSLDQLIAEAADNQAELARIGTKLERETGIEFDNPGAKKEDRIIEKVMTEGYSGAHEITDMARATFVIDNPGDADRVLAALSKDSIVYDKGWKHLEQSNYFDRKAFIHFDNGGVAEIQMVPRGVHKIKMGRGHALYEVARSPKSSIEQVELANAESRILYRGAIFGTDFANLIDRGKL